MAASPANTPRSRGGSPPPEGQRWKPGQSGNPSGRPKDYLTRALRERIGPEEAKKLAETLLTLALGGEMKALQEVFDRVEGKAIARQEQGDPGAFERLSALRDMSPDELREIIRVVDERKAKKTA